LIQLKNKEDLIKIKASCQMLALLFKEFDKMVEPGISLLEIDDFAYDFITNKNKAKPAFLNYLDFPNTVCISVNEIVIHGIPSARKLKEGDIVGLDCGINLDGYFSDRAYTYAVGKVAPEIEKLLDTTKQSLYLGIEKAQVGNRIRDISKTIEKKCKKAGYGLVENYCGHGVGFSQHEDPQIPNIYEGGPSPRIKNGMILALEPMVTLKKNDMEVLDDKWSVATKDKSYTAHFEHTIAIFDNKTEILTEL